jgi:glycerol-3-phosphate O-acyltransferase
MHRSHLDYILVGSKLYESNLNPPVVAAGINLSFFPIGFFIRSLGGYFVKRNARHDRVHAMLLRRYVAYLIKRGHLHEFFIEGGRSRNGRMRAPRLGLLSIMVNAYLKGQRREIVFVPVSITYENVIEDSVYAEENTGQKKKRESLGSLLAARELLRKRYGEVILNFGNPIALSTEVAKQRVARPEKAVDERELIATVASDLTHRIRTQTNPSLTSLVTGALMMTPRYGLSRDGLSDAVRRLATVVAIARTIDPEVGADTPALEGFLSGREHLLDSMGRGGLVSSGEVLGETTFFIEGKKRFTADFYRNATLHLFLPGGLMALTELLHGAIDLTAAARFHDIFGVDYLLGSAAQFDAELAAHFAAYRAHGLIVNGNAGPVFAERALGTFNPALMLGAIQTLLWIYDNLAATPSTSPLAKEAAPPKFGTATSLKTVPYGRFLTTLQEDYERLVYLRPAGRTEAASRTNLEGALESLHQRGIVAIVEGGGQPRDIEVLRESEGEITLLRAAERAILSWLHRDGRGDESGSVAPIELRPSLRLVDPST